MAYFVEKNNFLLTFIPYYCFDKKNCLNKSKFSSGFAPFKHGNKKKTFLRFSVLVSEIVTFMSIIKILYEFPTKWFKTTESHSLAVCGSICWEKQFLLIFIPFYLFDQKQLFKQIQIFLRICRFSNMVRKKTFWVFQCSFMK